MSELILTKRVRMNKIRQQITLIVLAASVCFGICMVLSIYFIKYMSFNSKVIASRDTSINNYYQTIKNVGICEDTDKDGKYNDKELAKCDPNKVDVSKMANTLRYNALVTMANNTNLESIARDGQKSCFDENKNHIDYSKLYLNSKNDNEKAYNLKMIKMCSALRVIPDALPAQKNDEALLASINQIFLLSGFEPEQLSPGNSYKNSGIPGVSIIPVSISVKKDEKDTMKVSKIPTLATKVTVKISERFISHPPFLFSWLLLLLFSWLFPQPFSSPPRLPYLSTPEYVPCLRHKPSHPFRAPPHLLYSTLRPVPLIQV